MNNKLKEYLDCFTDEVYQYIEWEYGILMCNKLKCCDLKVDQQIAMYYLGGNNRVYTAGELVRVYREHYKESYNKHGLH